MTLGENAAAILPDWTMRISNHWDGDVSYCFFRTGYKAFRLTVRKAGGVPSWSESGKWQASAGHTIIAATPPAFDGFHEIFSDPEQALASIIAYAESRKDI